MSMRWANKKSDYVEKKKKLYISCPIAGRKYEDAIKSLKKLKGIAEIIFEQEFDVVNNSKLIEVEGLTNELFIEHISDLAKADYFIGTSNCYFHGPWKNCSMEYEIAENIFKIPCYCVRIEDIAEDCCGLEEKILAVDICKSANIPCDF